VIWEAVSTWIFYFVSEASRSLAALRGGPAAGREAIQKWDIPLDIKYLTKRFEGFHMMTMVCTFLFPIALQGRHFQSSPEAAAHVVFGNVFALALKLTLQDASPQLVDAEIGLHAIRRSRPTAIFFMLIHPLSMLGIYLTGVGFVAAIVGKSLQFSRFLMCSGAAMTWLVTAITNSLHKASAGGGTEEEERQRSMVHHIKTALIAGCSFVFLAPLAFRLPQLTTSALVASTAVLLLAGTVFTEYTLADESHAEFMKRWKFHPPRALKYLDTMKESIGAEVHALEHFFTVLFAVAVFQLNEGLINEEHTMANVELYALKFMIYYGMLLHTMRYASRFNDDDAYHKLLWAGFQVSLLFLLEGAGADADKAWSLYKLMATIIFAAVGLFFSGRVVLQLKPTTIDNGKTVVDGRYHAAFFGIAALLQAGLMGATLPFDGYCTPLLYAVVMVSVLTQPVGTVTSFITFKLDPAKFRSRYIPFNIDYVMERFNGLLIEVLGVAIVVPNAVYPGGYAHPWRAAIGVLCAVALVLALKAGMFDVEPINADLHAVRRGPASANAFLSLHPLIVLGMAFMGGALRMLVESTASGAGPNLFAQRIMCAASALTMGSATLTKLSHKAEREEVHMAKVVLGLCGTGSHLLVWASGASDTYCMASIAGIHVATTVVQLLGGYLFPSAAQVQRRSSLRASRHSSLSKASVHVAESQDP